MLSWSCLPLLGLRATEERILATKNKADIDKMKSRFEEKNNYFTMYKKNDLAASTTQQAETHNREDFYKSLPFHRDTVNEYDPKNKKDRSYATHKAREGPLAQDVYQTPITSSQTYGWREPIDTLNLGLGLKNSFPENFSSVNFRDGPKKEKKN